MNMTILLLAGIAALALIVFVVVRNQKDKKALENKLNQDYLKPKNDEGDIEIDEKTK